MHLLIMCCDLEVADRRMTPAIKLVFAQASVSGATSLVRQLLGNRMLHRRPFAQRGSSPLCLHLGPQRLLERLVLANAQALALPARGFRALGAPGTPVTRRSRKLGRLAKAQRDALATRTRDLHVCKVQGESMLRAQRTNLRPGAGDNVPPPALPIGQSGGWPWSPDRYRAAASRGGCPTPRPAARLPRALAHWPGAPPPPG